MKYHSKIQALLACVAILGLFSGVALGEPPVVQLTNAASQSTSTYQVALDELYVPGSGIKKIPAQASLEGLSAFLVERTVATAETAFLVLYPPGVPHDEANRQLLTDKIVVETNSTGAASIASTAGVFSVAPVGDFAPGFYSVTVTNPSKTLDIAKQLGGMSHVKSVEPQIARQLQPKAIPNDTLFPLQWHLKNDAGGIDLNVSSVWDTNKGDSIVIGVVDTGVQISHEDLSPALINSLNYDFNDNDTDPTPTVFTSTSAHGTACAGLAGGRGFNGFGICGVAPRASLAGIRLIDGPTTDLQEANAFDWKKDAIAIKTNSWGPADNTQLRGPGPLGAAALQTAAASGRGGKGTVFLWAGGNGGPTDNSNADGFSNSIYAIAVAAVDENGIKISYSEPGANLLVAAPSGGDTTRQIETTDFMDAPGMSLTSYTSDFNGTSAACPQVAGVVALMLKANASLTWRDVQNILIRTAVKNDPADPDWVDNAAALHFNHFYGAGLVNAAEAVAGATSIPLLAPQLNSSAVAAGPFPLPIPESATPFVPVSFTIPVSTTIHSLEHAVLVFSATHTFRGDLLIELKSPGGTTSILTTVNGHDSGNDYLAWPFSTVRCWGEDPNGTWTVTVTDEQGVDVGSVTAATLKLYGTASTGGGGGGGAGGVVVVTSHLEGDQVSSGNITLQGTASLSVGVKQVEYRVFGFGSISKNTSPPRKWGVAAGATPWSFITKLPKGYNTIELRAVGNDGSISGSTYFHLLTK